MANGSADLFHQIQPSSSGPGVQRGHHNEFDKEEYWE